MQQQSEPGRIGIEPRLRAGRKHPVADIELRNRQTFSDAGVQFNLDWSGLVLSESAIGRTVCGMVRGGMRFQYSMLPGGRCLAETERPEQLRHRWHILLAYQQVD